ncbi:MAG TPA: 4Fe-4S cluster-binding domain-containing protein [Methanoregulaceae archaeon]|nr:4Fe-4S cluster-binding domain-containing protein [Methanoregulaceae archaeon]
MRNRIRRKTSQSKDIGSNGCRICRKGAKMVLFITGTCLRTCWYCPLSRERKGIDITYANEHPVTSPDEAVQVSRIMSALGTGVTGGEPLLHLDRVIEYCARLKQEFGDAHHIHLYTGTAPDSETFGALKGLVDEIRLHPPEEDWPLFLSGSYAESVTIAKSMGFDIGVEVPALPSVGELEPALKILDFLNINELEWGDTNAEEMRERGYTLEDGYHNAVKGAREWAYRISRDEKVHFCSSSFKDSVQLRKRLIRIARNTARPFDHITRDGTIIYGNLVPAGTDTSWLGNLSPGSYENCADHIELSWKILHKQAEVLTGECSIVERYPDHGMIVEVTPL